MEPTAQITKLVELVTRQERLSILSYPTPQIMYKLRHIECANYVSGLLGLARSGLRSNTFGKEVVGAKCHGQLYQQYLLYGIRNLPLHLGACV